MCIYIYVYIYIYICIYMGVGFTQERAKFGSTCAAEAEGGGVEGDSVVSSVLDARASEVAADTSATKNTFLEPDFTCIQRIKNEKTGNIRIGSLTFRSDPKVSFEKVTPT